MIRHVFIFLGTFVVGALIALGARTAMFKPHAGQSGHAHSAGETTPMVSNVLAPAQNRAPAADPHADHAAPAPAPAKAPDAPGDHDAHGSVKPAATPAASASTDAVNTVCAICGMDVDPKIPTIEYQGKKIGFGCKMCPPKFKADPDKYGPIYLRNEVLKK